MLDYYTFEYQYDAIGNKLSKTISDEFKSDPSLPDENPLKTDYVGNFIYENGVLKRILHDEGVIEVLSNNNYEYQFFIKDHLGNTRVVCKPDFNSNGTLKDKPTVLQRSDYYPFGMLHGGVDFPDLYTKSAKDGLKNLVASMLIFEKWIIATKYL